MPQSLLEVCELTVSFPGAATPSVDSATFSLQEGEILGLMGESGAGKTTLARAIAGRLPSCIQLTGHAILRGFDVLATRPRGLISTRGPRVAFIPQEPESVLNPVRRVRDQIEEVVRAGSATSAATTRESSYRALSLTGLSADIGMAYPHQLSGGQRQRVVIAQALSSQPVLMIADEPTSALDNVVQSEILRVLQEVTQRLRLALLFVTHDATLLPGFADRTLVMQNGAIVECGETRQLFRAPGHRHTKKIIQAIAPLPSSSRDSEPSVSSESRDMVAEVSGVTKAYIAGRSMIAKKRRVTALDGVNLTLARGSVVALVGKSGSGKSTLARCLASIDTPDSGVVRVGGHSLTSVGGKARKEFRRSVQLVWQHSALSLNPRLRVGESVAEPMLVRREFSREECYRLALDVMRHLGLNPAVAERIPSQISGGQRQRVALARALVIRPSILILDEAFAGLDLPVQQEISDALIDLRSSRGLTILFITHDLRRAAAIGDEIVVIDAGQIVERAEPTRLLRNPQHAATQQLVGTTPMFDS